MKKIGKLKLTQLNKITLEAKQLNAIKGGACPCVCVGCLCSGGEYAMNWTDAPYGGAEAQLTGIENRG
jgi:natural product precursor